jgi:hypothetical protein
MLPVVKRMEMSCKVPMDWLHCSLDLVSLNFNKRAIFNVFSKVVQRRALNREDCEWRLELVLVLLVKIELYFRKALFLNLCNKGNSKMVNSSRLKKDRE